MTVATPEAHRSDHPQQAAEFLGRPGDAHTIAVATEAIPLVAQFVSQYVRGDVTDDAGAWHPELAALGTAALARVVTNPAQTESESGEGYAARGDSTAS